MNDNNTATGSEIDAVTDPEAALEALRVELDRVDRTLLEGVRDRLALCTRVAELKQQHDIAVLQPGRMQLVQRRARDYADRHGLSAEFVRELYDLLIEEACRVEDLIVAGGEKTAPGDLDDTVSAEHRS
ncbi:chorismate mutase [Rhodococcus artemisiae]|uniref:Chorismate mutase family protein n=1 Tax=Rhodococcus artemisiae TaxID=714159 RepID=A0ABU7LK02_9NOCA|nr:chorismate mutase family protein [Rhodococcus artemisiae]MEE2061895.1 chorismate mutase family protein [Rhodococcus artemisiae]